MLIYYFDALAGAGKTHALAIYADRLARSGKKVLIVQPTKALIDKTVADELAPLCDGTYPITPIHGDTVQDGVAKALGEHTAALDRETGEVVLISHRAFETAPFLRYRDCWTVIIDEVPSVVRLDEISLPRTHAMITDLTMLGASGPGFGELVSDSREMRDIAENRQQDAVYDVIRGVACDIVSEDHEVCVSAQQHKSLLARATRSLITYTTTRPSRYEGYERVIVCSALFRQSLMYAIWSAMGVKFVPVDQDWSASLRYTAHANGSRVTVYYAADGDWSKAYRDRDGMLNKAVKAVRELLGDQPFAWMGNRDLPDTLWGDALAERLPHMPHGRNDFQHHHNCVVMSALNPPTHFIGFLKSRGLSPDEIRQGIYLSAVYQAVMRCSLRDPNATGPVRIVVMDKGAADYIAGLFASAKVEPLPGMVAGNKKRAGRPRKHSSDAERKRNERNKKRSQLEMGMKSLIESLPQLEHYWDENLVRKYPLRLIRNKRTEIASQLIQIPIYDSKTANEPFQFSTGEKPGEGEERTSVLDYAGSDDFVGLLKDLSAEMCLTCKEAGYLIAGAHFAANPSTETKRGKDNVVYMLGIWIDCDGGDLTPHGLAALLPHVRIAIYSTFSSTIARPRWRAYIPTSHPMPVALHRLIADRIHQIVREAGYFSDEDIKRGKRGKRHGWDMGKFMTPSSLYYLPSQAANPTDTFFHDFADGRADLDVPRWLEDCVNMYEPEPMPSASPVRAAGSARKAIPESVGSEMRKMLEAMRAKQEASAAASRQARVEQAISDWRGTPRGQGHAEFYRLAIRLHNAGVPEDDVRTILYEEAGTAMGTAAERKKEIRGIMTKLRKVGTLRK